MKKKLPFIIILVLTIIAVCLGVFYHFDTKTKFNEGYVNGNTAGNLYNSGQFCEYDGTVYFANPSDGNKLYSMRSDGSQLTKLSEDIPSFINADENYIYYVRNNPRSDYSKYSFVNINSNSLCRADHDGKNVLVLDPKPCLYASLFGNYVFYLHYEKENATTLYRVKIDGTEKEQVDENPYQTCCASGQYFYYTGPEGAVWRYDTASLTASQVYSDNCWLPTVLPDGELYYMDCNHNYKLTKADLAGGEKTHLAEDRLDTFNVCGDYIYFQRSSDTEPALCRMRTDGSDYRVIAEGVYSDINTTATDVYFREFSSDVTFRTPINDPDTVEGFTPGK